MKTKILYEYTILGDGRMYCCVGESLIVISHCINIMIDTIPWIGRSTHALITLCILS